MNANQVKAKNELLSILKNQRKTDKYTLAAMVDSLRGANSFKVHSLDLYKRAELLEMVINEIDNCNALSKVLNFACYAEIKNLYNSMDGIEKTDTYQFKSGVRGWGDGNEIGTLIYGITHNQALTIAYGYALINGREARIAKVTGYENLTERNFAGETLGNGIYLDHKRANDYLTENN